MDKIKIIIRKEWAEVFKNRMVFFSIIFMPLMMTALPLIILYATGDSSAGDLSSQMPEQFSRYCPQNLNGTECFQFYMVTQFMFMFMLIPLMIPVNIAAYSIVGEKTTRSLEPLLATPITTSELLIAKNLAATIPAVLATWIGFAIFAIGAGIISTSRNLMLALMDPLWLIAIFIVGPLLAILSVNFSIMVSSRVNDPRVAEQLSAVVIIPLLVLFFGQISGFIFLSRQLILVIAAVLLVIDIAIIYMAVRLFQRETILTRWK